MISIPQLINKTKQLRWNGNPKIGWWLDNDPVTFYHGTHINNIIGILKDGIYAPKSGPTAGFVSLALEPNTSFAYASMSGAGGESGFRGAGQAARHTPKEERVVFVLEIPQSYFKSRMAPARGAMDVEREKLTNKEKYDAWVKTKKSDQEYYAITEIRLPKHVPAKYIVGYMLK